MREFGSEFEISYRPDSYFKSIVGKLPFSAFTRSGREAIGLAILGMKPGVALLPAYCCWSMVLPFESAGWQVVYYPLNTGLRIDCDALLALIEDLSPSAVLVMDYFGFTPTADAVRVIRKASNEILIIEDFTQCLLSLDKKWNADVDCYVASIRKSIGVPDGGMVLSRKPLMISKLSNERTLFVEHHIQAGVRKKWYSYSANSEEKQLFRELQAAASDEIKKDYHLYKISMESMAIIENTDVETVRFARRKNYEHLYELLRGNQQFSILFAPEGNEAPFMFVINSQRRDELQKTYAQKGVYCQVIWPLSDEAKKMCQVSKEMENTMLAIPIDQRYSYDDIEEIGKRINSVKL